MHLTARTEFLLHQPADSTGAAASQCALLRAEIEVDSVRADTLFVRRLLDVSQERGVRPCRGVGAGIVVASENPTLRAQTGAGSQSGTIMAYLIGGALFVTSALVFAYMMIGS